MVSAFQLVIFDCDGVLVDSERITAQVLAQCLAEQGAPLDWRTVLQRFIGQSDAQDRQTAAEILGHMPPEAFWQDLSARVHRALAADVVAVPHIQTALDTLGLPYCTASNGSLAKMNTTLGTCGLLDRFAGRLFSAQQVARGKPAPDLFLLAAGTLGVAPEHCAVVEDSPTGVRAAVAAGMTAFGYAALTPAETLLQAGATLVFDDMRQLPALLKGPLGKRAPGGHQTDHPA